METTATQVPTVTQLATASQVATVPEAAGGHIVDRLLLDSKQLTTEIRQDRADRSLVPRLLAVIAGGVAIYGVSVGLQGGLLQAAVTAVKLPLVMLVASGLTLPVLHLGCALSGFRVRFDQLSALVLQSLGTASLTMAGLAPIVVVAWLTLSAGHAAEWWIYRRVFLLAVAVAGVGGLAGAARLLRAVPLRAAVPWAASFSIAGLQLSWLLRPIVGMPDSEFVLARGLESNALSEVLTALWAVLS